MVPKSFVSKKRRGKIYNTIILLVLLTGFGITNSFAATYYSRASGNWNTASTWSTASCGGAAAAAFPVAGDIVYICNNNVVTITANAACASIIFENNGTTTTLTVNGGFTLTVSGSITLNSASAANTGCNISGTGSITCANINIGGADPAPATNNTTYTNIITSTITSLNISGNLAFNAWQGNTQSKLTRPEFLFQSGTLNVDGQITAASESGNNFSDFLMNSGAQSGTLLVSDATPFPAPTSGTFNRTLNGTSTVVNYDLAGAQTVFATTYTNLTISGSGNKFFSTGTTINGTMSIQGTATSTGSAVTYIGTSTLEYKGSAAQTASAIEFPSTSGPQNLIINNASGVSFPATFPRTISGTLTFTNGLLTTSSGSELTVNNPSVTAITGASTSRYINGPLIWSLAAGSTYSFPVGKGGTFYPFSLTSITGSSPEIKVEAFYADPGGTIDGTLSAKSNTEYWSSSVTSGTLSGASVSLTRQTALGTFNAIARSSTQTGTYSNLNGNATGTSINNSDNTGSSLGFFVMATKVTTSTTLTISNPTTAVTASSICASSLNVPIHAVNISANGVTGSGTLTNFQIVTTGTYAVSDISNFKIWYNSTDNLSTATLASTKIPVTTAGTQTFPAFTLNIPAGTTYYIWITMDVSTAINDRTIAVNGSLASDMTTTLTKAGGPTNASGTQTLKATPTAVTVSGGGTFCNSATLNASGGTGGTIYYQGTTSNGTSTATPSTSQIVTLSGTYYFRAVNAGCWGTQGSATVTINPNPTITLGTEPTVCKGTIAANLTYSATTASPNQYSIDYDATAQGQGFVDVTNAALPASPIVLVVPANANPGTYNYTVSVRNSTTGCVSSLYSKTITVNPPAPVTPGTISGQATVNSNTSGLIYSISDVTNATSYNWTVPTGWTINSGQGTTSISLTSGSAGQNGNISVTASNSCGTSAASTFAVTVYSGNCPQMTSVSPSETQTICQGGTTTTLTATVTLSGGNGTPTLQYQWYYNTTSSNTITGATKLTGETNATYSPQNSTSDTRYYFCVGYASDNGCGQTDATQILASNTVQVTVNPPAPAAPGAITGPSSVSPNSTGITYSIAPVTNASSYTWSAPLGWTLTSGQGTTSITVTAGSLGQNGNITVSASNSCGTSATTMKNVTVTATAPTITLGTIQTVCRGTTTALLPYTATTENPDKYSIDYNSTANTAGFVDVVDATLPASPISLVVPAAVAAGNYTGSLRVKNTSTGLSSIAYTITIRVIATPATPGAISGMILVAQNTPGNVYSISSVTYATTYNWTVPAGWTITAGQGTSSVTVTAGAAGQNGNISVTASNTCGTSAASSLAVQSVIPTNHATYNCNSCHIFHSATGTTLTTIAGNANLCISCHQNGAPASGKPLSNAMKAIPGTSGTSHSWDVAALNSVRETTYPSNTEMYKRLDSISPSQRNITCSTCHNQHNSNTNPSYLRIDNTGDALCKECHTPRNVGRYTDNTATNKGSHPVGLTYPASNSNYKTSPTAPFTTPGGKIECSSCHQTHYATTTDGNLLRATSNAAMCTSCHNYGTHNGMDCLKCHQTHNTNKSNIFMIRNTIATPNSGNKTVNLTARTGTNSFADGNTTYDGICEVCHTTTTHFRNNGLGSDQNHTSQGAGIPGQNCTTCHSHSSNFATPNCTSCHNAINTPTTGIFTTDAHSTHVTRYGYACSICHFGQGSGGSSEPTHPSGGLGEVTFDPNGLAKRNGLDAAVPTYSTTNQTCTNVYCHSNGRSAIRGTDGTYTWSGTIGSQTPIYTITPNWYTGSINTCSSCHEGSGNMNSPYTITTPGLADPLPPATGSHQRGAHTSNSQELSGNGWAAVNCFWCHNANSGNSTPTMYQGTYGTSFHVDGQTYFKPLSFVNGGTMVNATVSGGGTFSYSSNGSAGHCGNGKTCW